jgi:Matrixin
MTKSTCGLPDMFNGVAASTRCRWTQRGLTYAFNNGTNDIAGQDEFQAVRNAFSTWASIVPFTFTEVGVNNNPEIEIDWRNANDPDSSMVGSVHAHADYPPGCWTNKKSS